LNATGEQCHADRTLNRGEQTFRAKILNRMNEMEIFMSIDSRIEAFNQSIGKFLHDAREQAKISIEEAANHLNQKPEFIQKLEAGSGDLTGHMFHVLISKYGISDTDVNQFLESFGMKVSSPRAKEL
jgi:ribosome-binding protein aMBF1 (putative translation factor)